MARKRQSQPRKTCRCIVRWQDVTPLPDTERFLYTKNFYLRRYHNNKEKINEQERHRSDCHPQKKTKRKINEREEKRRKKKFTS